MVEVVLYRWGEIGEEDVTSLQVLFMFNGALRLQSWSKVQKEVSCICSKQAGTGQKGGRREEAASGWFKWFSFQ